jgi:hypothetical protein
MVLLVNNELVMVSMEAIPGQFKIRSAFSRREWGNHGHGLGSKCEPRTSWIQRTRPQRSVGSNMGKNEHEVKESSVQYNEREWVGRGIRV